MWINHLVQVDVPLPTVNGRFWMDSCGGRDQVAVTVQQSGWTAYEPRLPALIVAWCAAQKPVFIDVGSKTGFYSLLALASGATQVEAFEPVLEIAQVMAANARISELNQALTVHVLALGNSHGETNLTVPQETLGLMPTLESTSSEFRSQHEKIRPVPIQKLDAVLPTLTDVPVLLKIAVGSRAVAVLSGAIQLLQRYRPAVICKILPDADASYFDAFCRTYGYQHFALDTGSPVSKPELTLSLEARHHVFLPAEAAGRWLNASL